MRKLSTVERCLVGGANGFIAGSVFSYQMDQGRPVVAFLSFVVIILGFTIRDMAHA